MPITIDNSTLSSLAGCSTQAAMRYHFGWTAEDSAALAAGTAVHTAIHEWVKEKFDVTKGVQALLAAYQESDVLTQLSPDDRLDISNVERIMQHWFTTRTPASFPFSLRPELCEIGFTVPLDDHGDFLLTGRMDALAGTDTGAWWVIDWKTTGRIDRFWRDKWSYASQITGYVWAAQQHFVDMPVAGAFAVGIELAKLPTDTKKCRNHAVPYTECGPLHANHTIIAAPRSPATINEWRKTALHLAKRWQDTIDRVGDDLSKITKLRTQGTFSDQCRWCGFQGWCVAGRNTDAVPSIFRYSPWKPHEAS